MTVLRSDFIEKKGVYSLGGKDGEWIVHSHHEQPYITMKRIDTGELFDMPMQSMHNVKSVLLRKLEKGEKTAEASAKEVIKEVEKELTKEQVKENVSGIANLMLQDGVALMGIISQLNSKPNKKLIEQIESWKIQVEDFVGGSSELEHGQYETEEGDEDEDSSEQNTVNED